MLAREIHQLSPRHSETMLSVDMGAISESLFESELFGHERGAFTDARESRPGKFEAANGSSLFMDEIGNLPLSLQAKLLTVLQNRNLMRIGSNKIIPIDIRLISATNKDIPEMIKEGAFREDLFYRIIQYILKYLRYVNEETIYSCLLILFYVNLPQNINAPIYKCTSKLLRSYVPIIGPETYGSCNIPSKKQLFFAIAMSYVLKISL